MTTRTDDQDALWNGPAGHAWVTAQQLLDGMFQPFEELLVQAARDAQASDILDIGCGTGATTVALARATGRPVLGIDISEPMLAAARERATRDGIPARFLHADAARHVFDEQAFDLIVSRFGVMFFEDPIAAFANLRHAARPGAGLCAITWRSPQENPFMTTAERAAAPFLPALPPRLPDTPGQFGLADAARTRNLLQQAGWSDIDIRPLDISCRIPASGLALYVTHLGPLGRVLNEASEAARAEIIATALAAFAPFITGDEVRFTAACWQITARAP